MKSHENCVAQMVKLMTGTELENNVISDYIINIMRLTLIKKLSIMKGTQFLLERGQLSFGSFTELKPFINEYDTSTNYKNQL
jgi:hypothetical protein